MTLLQRLQPQFTQKLESVKKEYPSAYNNIINILTENEYYSELKISDAVSICFYFNIDFNIGNINDLFNE